MKLSENPCPSDTLVDWACRCARDVRLPADRPWFMAPPPPTDAKHWEYSCRCRRGPVRVHRYLCNEGRDFLYLGQCPRCETVIWAYRHRHEGCENAA